MSEAKPQDGSTVKGYRTLTDGDIERMNRLKGVSRHFCSLLDTERGELLAVRNEPAMLSAEQAREIDEAMRNWHSRAPKCRKPVCGHAGQSPGLMLTVNPLRAKSAFIPT